ncbi:MAG TPA: hypothetical protein VK190_03150 [Pseudoneobacillus sp.]|jgi:hypothetical protein|nr:hypothetical protein [Pseudoneobacillus sp.]
MINPGMLNPIERALYDTTLNKFNNTKASPTTGTIVSIDDSKWTAKVEIVDPFNGDTIVKDDVAIPVGANGVKAANPSPGDIVAINFASGDIYSPYIVNVFQGMTQPITQSENPLSQEGPEPQATKKQVSPNAMSSAWGAEIPEAFGTR